MKTKATALPRLKTRLTRYTRIAEFLKKYAEPAKCGCNLE